MAARRDRSRRSEAVIPPSWEPRTMRSGSPSAAISSSMAMFTTASLFPCLLGLSVRGRQRLGALDGQDRLADRDGTLTGLGAQELQAELVIAVALAQLRAAVEPRHDALGRG